jgi:flagellar protein FliO/FliZ
MCKHVLSVVVVAAFGASAAWAEAAAPAAASPTAASPAAASPAVDAPADAVAESAAAPEPASAPAAAKPPPPPLFDPDETSASLTATEVVAPMVKTVVALSIVLLLAWLTLHKGMGRLVERAQAGKRLRVVERVALDARRSLFLVEVDGKTLVVGGGDLVRIDAPSSSSESLDGFVRGAAFEKVLASTQSKPSSTASSSESA